VICVETLRTVKDHRRVESLLELEGRLRDSGIFRALAAYGLEV
jgi:hypothetical protein